MAITAKVNMVLHGDGSAHIFKYDGLAPLDRLEDDRLRPLADAQRSVERKRYKPDVSERFDAVVSNPPFGITLAAESRAARARTFSAPASAPSEALFLERWFQLLKPKGRLGVVVPESLLNTGDATEYRLFLYRFFWIRAIVAMSRNIFIETPTLTSLLFAQKKTSEAAAEWDRLWEAESARVETSVRDVETYLEMVRRSSEVKPEQITDQVLVKLRGMLGNSLEFMVKKGAGPIDLDEGVPLDSSADTIAFFLDLLKLASFKQVLRNHIFTGVATTLDYEYSVYRVDEIGCKLSKRKERLRPNQLVYYKDVVSEKEVPNSHLASSETETVVDILNPQRVLDFIRRDVT